MKVLVLFALASTIGYAQLSKVSLESSPEPQKSSSPWKFSGTLGLNFPWIATKNFVGASSKPSINPSTQLSLELLYRQDPHEWRSHISESLGYTYAPPPNDWVKSSDALKIDSFYLYHIGPNWGAFGGLQLKTSILPGEDIESTPSTYVITDAVTNKIVNTITASRLHLSNAFAPLFLEELAGLFYRISDKPKFFLELRGGATGRENFAEGQLAITCNGGPDCTNIMVQQLANVYELGPGAGVLFKTMFWNGKLSFRTDFDLMYALVQEPQIKPPGSWNRLSFDLSSNLGFTLLSWLSLNWSLRTLLNPAVIEQVQFLSNLSLAASFGI